MITEGDSVPKKLKGVIVNSQTKPQDPEKEEPLKGLYQKSLTILYFYPKDMTPGCTTQAKEFQENLKKITSMGAEIYGCSRDPQKSHCKFIDKHGLMFPLISDTTGEVTEAFGVWTEKKMYGKTFMGIIRSTFILENGKVIKAYPKVKLKEHMGEIIDFIKSRKS